MCCCNIVQSRFNNSSIGIKYLLIMSRWFLVYGFNSNSKATIDYSRLQIHCQSFRCKYQSCVGSDITFSVFEKEGRKKKSWQRKGAIQIPAHIQKVELVSFPNKSKENSAELRRRYVIKFQKNK